MDINAILSRCAGFDWDKRNADKNLLKHGVSTGECEQVFFNQPFVVQWDPAHSKMETRFYALGKTDAMPRLFVAFTLRRDRVRVISARDMSAKERRVYESFEKGS